MIDFTKCKTKKDLERVAAEFAEKLKYGGPMGIPALFTEAELAIIIDKWYFEWKDRIVDKNIPHKLGFAKEDLQQKIASMAIEFQRQGMIKCRQWTCNKPSVWFAISVKGNVVANYCDEHYHSHAIPHKIGIKSKWKRV
jgi:hypothetical protein